MKAKIKIVFDTEEQLYYCFSEGFPLVEGWGETEQDAISNFHVNLEFQMGKD